MKNMNDNQPTTSAIPESWKIPEKDIQTAWDKKSVQFAESKKYFEKELAEKQ